MLVVVADSVAEAVVVLAVAEVDLGAVVVLVAAVLVVEAAVAVDLSMYRSC